MAGTKYEQILQDLIKLIQEGRAAPGAKLPTERDLAADYQVARLTARRALGDLVQMGLAERRGSGGTRVREFPGEEVNTDTLNLICSAEAVASIQEFLYHGVRLAGEFGFQEKVIRISKDDPEPARKALFLPSRSILLAERLDLTEGAPLYRALIANRTRSVVLGNDLSKEGVPSVTCDDQAGMQLALQTLRRYGHRKIALIADSEPLEHPVLHEMWQAWDRHLADEYDAKERVGLLVQLAEAPFDFLALNTYHKLCTALRQSPLSEATALLCLKTEIARGAIAACRELGKSVPKDVSVIEYGLTPDSKVASLVRSGVETHMEDHVQLALNLLGNSPIKNKKDLHLVVPEFSRGDTLTRVIRRKTK